MQGLPWQIFGIGGDAVHGDFGVKIAACFSAGGFRKPRAFDHYTTTCRLLGANFCHERVNVAADFCELIFGGFGEFRVPRGQSQSWLP